MNGVYLEVTFRSGRPLAAYLYLPRREGDRAARSEKRGHGLVVDYAADGRPIGIEFTSVRGAVPLEAVNAVLAEAQARPATAAELEPLKVA